MNKKVKLIFIISIIVLNIYPVIYLFTDHLFDLLGVVNTIIFLVLFLIKNADSSRKLYNKQHKIKEKNAFFLNLDIRFINILMAFEGALGLVFIGLAIAL